MASEKVTAALEVQQAAAIAALTGYAAQIPSRTLAIYRRKMRTSPRQSKIVGPDGSLNPLSKRPT